MGKPPPALPLPHPLAKPTSHRRGGKHNLFLLSKDPNCEARFKTRLLRFVLVTFCCAFSGAMSDGARVHGGSAARRRDCRLRHERLSIRMCVAEMRHHAAPQPIHFHVGTQTAATVIKYVAPASALVIEYVAPVSVTTRLEHPVFVVHVVQVPTAQVIEKPLSFHLSLKLWKPQRPLRW